MLKSLSIENMAVIEKATVEFNNGLNVLTGETGAGKSILINAINGIIGNKLNKDIVRSGQQKAKIWATFVDVKPFIKNFLEETGYPLEENELLIYREVSSEGKSVCRVNGMPITLSILRELTGQLISIHGQHDSHNLTNPAKHLELLDTFAQNEKLLKKYQSRYYEMLELKSIYEDLSTHETARNEKIELLNYEIDEITQAALEPDEDLTLMSKRDAIKNAQTILSALNEVYTTLAGNDDFSGATSMLGDCANQIENITQYVPELEKKAENLQELYYSAGEVASDIQDFIVNFDFNASALDEIEERLDVIYKLKQKYGNTIEDILNHLEDNQNELDSIAFSSEKLLQVESDYYDALAETNELADNLTLERISAFENMKDEVTDALTFLNMPNIQFDLKGEQKQLGPTGHDDAAFYISTNLGEPPKPLAKIASGGELSRIMLAIKSTVSDKDNIDTVIYDEIDTGISGKAAGQIGQMLKETANNRQVICVTHTAQVAAYATTHLFIRKDVQDNHTYTKIISLTEHESINELARIISGDKVTKLSQANAKELKELSNKTNKISKNKGL